MKKLLFLLLTVSLLIGCAKPIQFYDSPLDSYEKGFDNGETIQQEIDCIEIDSENVFWLAIIGTPGQPRILEAITQVQNGKYAAINRYHSTPLQSAENNTLNEQYTTWQTEWLDEENQKCLVWIWVSTAHLTENDRTKYICKDYVIHIGEKTMETTLVYYILETEE